MAPITVIIFHLWFFIHLLRLALLLRWSQLRGWCLTIPINHHKFHLCRLWGFGQCCRRNTCHILQKKRMLENNGFKIKHLRFRSFSHSAKHPRETLSPHISTHVLENLQTSVQSLQHTCLLPSSKRNVKTVSTREVVVSLLGQISPKKHNLASKLASSVHQHWSGRRHHCHLAPSAAQQ